MIKWELKKLWSYKPVVWLLLAMIVLNIGQIIYQNYPNLHGELYIGRQKINQLVEGKITQEKYETLLKYYQDASQKVAIGDYQTDKIDENTFSGYVFGDSQILEEVVNEYQKCLDYQKDIQRIIDKAKENLTFSKDKSWNEYNQKIISSYQNRSLSYYYDYTIMNSYVNYDFSYLLILVIVVFMTVCIFIHEKKDTQIYFSLVKNGIKRSFFPKLTALFISTLLVVILFAIQNFIVFYLLGANNGWLQPIYALQQFRLSDSTISIVVYHLIDTIFKCLGSLIFSLILVCIYNFLKKDYLGILIGAGLIVAMIFIYNLHNYSVISFSSIRELIINNNMNSYIFIIAMLIIICGSIINYFGYVWWQNHEKNT